MSFSRSLASLLCGGAMFAAAHTLSAADKLDLERLTPVATDQPIPVVDFSASR